jgi:uncharacterized protein
MTAPRAAVLPRLTEHPAADLPLGSAGADRVARARRGLLAYLAVVVVLSAIIDALIIATRQFVPLVLVLMFVPTVAAVGVRLARHEGFADVSFRFGGRRTLGWLLLALALPWVVGLLGYGTAWLTGLATFVPPERLAAAPTALAGLGLLASGWLMALPLSCASAAGEEIGWRGYMLTRLIDARVPYPILTSGLIWGLWHTPLILAGLYAAGPDPRLSAAVFLVSVAAFGALIARARLETGSIWPAIVLHGAWNLTIQGVFDRATTGAAALLWTGESGLLVAAALVLVAVVGTRGRWPLLRMVPRRGEPTSAEIRA